MAESGFRLDHLNLPARDPEGLARWYARTFDLQADGHRLRGPGMLIAFQAGEPVKRAAEFHVGFRVENMKVLIEWAAKFSAQIATGSEFASFRTFDPEDNCLEIYCRADT